jgi:hypothetical protein
MRNILHYLRQHFAADFKLLYYLAVFGFIAACILLNYLTAPPGFRSWEGWIIRRYYAPGSIWCFPIYFVFYTFPYLTIAGITAFFHQDAGFFKKREFWLRTIFILAAISWQATFSIHRLAARTFSNPSDQYFLSKILGPLNPYLMIGLPLLAFWWWRDRKRGVPFMYGFVRKGFDPLPYFILLGLMVPVIGFAATQPQFLNYYPTLRLNLLKDLTLVQQQWLAFAIYEIVYGLYFIWAEIIFRGFLTVGMADTMDRHAVAPMSGLYAFMHFAKPPGETISSVLGGHILGVIALRSQNIVGGAIIHGGIAVMMDVFALVMSYEL